MDEASIKGLLVMGLWQRIHDLVEQELCGVEEVEVRLEARDIDILDRKIEPTLWYPASTVARYADFLMETVGPPNRRELLERGHRAAVAILTTPTYTTHLSSIRGRPDAVVKIIGQIGRQLFNFGDWTAQVSDDGEYTITFTGSGALPDPVRHQLEGAISAILRDVTGQTFWICSGRPYPDRMVFHCEPD